MTVSRRLVDFSVVACLLALTACASASAPGAPDDPFAGEARGFDEEVLFTIENNDFRDATIYGYWNGVRERLGMVTGKTSETFSTEWKAETFHFFVNFVGGGTYTSERLDVYGGDHLNFVILPSF